MAGKRKSLASSTPGSDRPTKLRRSPRNAAAYSASIPGPPTAPGTVETTAESPNMPDVEDTFHYVETPDTTDASMAEVTSADAQPPATVLEEVDGAPPAWADDRPSLACTIPWFNSNQAGMYHKDGLCRGLLIDGDCGVRSYIDDEVVITRLGGGSEKVNGRLVVKKNQDEKDLRVRSITNSMNSKEIIGLVLGNQNQLLNRKLPHRFNVMDYFQIAKVWPERQDGCIFYRVRFEKLDISQKSWWARKGAPDPIPYAHRAMQPVVKVCRSCNVEEMQVYKEGWICLNRKCNDFWQINGQDITNSMGLTFHEAFLEYRLPPLQSPSAVDSLVPDRLSEVSETEVKERHFSFSREAMKGIVCPVCRRCIPRLFWEGWKCSVDLVNQAVGTDVHTKDMCPFEKWINIQPLSLDEAVGSGKVKRDSSVGSYCLLPEANDELVSPYTIHTYNVAGAGYIFHFVANKAINERPGGPNDLFKELQETKLGLRRFPLTQAVVPGTLQAQFAVNYGLPYKFVVPSASLAFNDACDAIHRVLGRLTWATQQAVASKGETANDPNELLVLGYQERQKIGYHDDGEDSLESTIASLSLGAPSTMKIRMKYKFYHGFTPGGKKSNTPLVIDPVLPNCDNYKERLVLKTKFNNPPGNKKDYEKWRVEHFGKEPDSKKKHQDWWDEYREAWWGWYQTVAAKSRESPPDLIKMELNHGDMVVMHGEKLQQYFEHGVDVKDNGKLRFALTARRIKSEMVNKEDLPKGDFHLTGNQVYDGR